MVDLLWIVVAYGNRDEVSLFVEKVAPVGGARFGWAICDNSPAPVAALRLPSSHTFVSRPDNPGYLEGALIGLDAWRAEHGSLPAWVVVTNTDLDLVSGNPLDVLRTFDPEAPLVIAPRITEGPESIEKNPHIMEARSRWRLKANRWATATTGLAWLYLVASRVRQRLRVRRGGVTGASSMDTRERVTMFAPYGAMMFFSRGFLSLNAIPRCVPLMTEEYFVGEASRAVGAPVLYVPEIHVHHVAHQTTGAKISLQRAKAISKGFRAIAHGLPR